MKLGLLQLNNSAVSQSGYSSSQNKENKIFFSVCTWLVTAVCCKVTLQALPSCFILPTCIQLTHEQGKSWEFSEKHGEIDWTEHLQFTDAAEKGLYLYCFAFVPWREKGP